MTVLRKIPLLFLLLIAFGSGFAQPIAVVDSMKKELVKAQTTAEKVYDLDIISRALMNLDLKEADKYGEQLIEVAEESRDRKLMIKAYMSNGLRCNYVFANKEYIYRAIGYYNKALALARGNKYDEEAGATLLSLSTVHLAIPDRDKALNYVNQGASIISTLNNDSLKIEVHNRYGNVYLTRNEKIISLRHYLAGLRMAEDIRNPALIRTCNLYLSNFYSSIEDYDKAIDYYMIAYSKLPDIKDISMRYAGITDMNSIGNLYSAKKNYDIAITYFERSSAIADSMKFPTMKVQVYVSLLNQYLRMNDPKKALDYFNSPPGMALQKFLTDFGFSGVVDQAYGVIYTGLNQYDSATYYFASATPFFEKTFNEMMKMSFYAQLATLHKKKGDYKTAIEMFLKVKEMADKTDQLESGERAAKQLDSLYAWTGNYQLASQYNSVYHQYKDSLEKMNKERELTQVEAADEQLRLQRAERAKLEAKRKRYAIQYFGITIAIAALVVVLVMLGMFKVSRTTIKMIGFFTFLMFFEFIFLIFKKNITSITEGEPWKDLLFMIGLAAILLPLHHWLEHKVIHYLTSHNRLTAAGKELRMRLFARKKV